MAIEKDNDCCSCEHCVGCGRGNYLYTTCDRCGDSAERYMEIDDEILCWDCFKKSLDCKEVDDETGCYDLYLYEDALLDEDALQLLFKKQSVTEQEIIERFEED